MIQEEIPLKRIVQFAAVGPSRLALGISSETW